MNLAEVKSKIIFNQNSIKVLSKEIETLIEQETELIKEENNCKQFIPPKSEFSRQHRCIQCGQWERAHKSN